MYVTSAKPCLKLSLTPPRAPTSSWSRVKPALAYLDVIAAVKAKVLQPVAAYQVSGEYACVHFAARAGAADLKAMALETLTAITRAGAEIILSYFTRQLYAMERKISQSYFNDALEVMPGGVNSPVRAFKAVGGTPITFAKGEGPWLTDVDGNRYLDFCCSWGPLILGHAHPRVVEAIEEVLRKGWSFGAPHRSETELARVVLQKLEFAERIRFVNSGTEAVMTAIRLARGVTGRPLIIKFEGCYHGHVDSRQRRRSRADRSHNPYSAAGR